MKINQILSLIILIFTALEAVGQQLADSIIKVNPAGVTVARSYFSYNDDDYQTMAMHYTFNKKNSKWVGTYKETATYDEQGNCLVHDVSYWDMVGNRWFTMVNEINTYDRKGRRTSGDARQWNKEREVWIGVSKNAFTFNDMGLLATEEHYEWLEEAEVWREKTRAVYEYDDRGRRIEEIEYNYFDGQWINSIRRTNTYNVENRQLEKTIEQKWNGNDWELTQKTELTYEKSTDRATRTTIQLRQTYDEAQQDWVNLERTTSTMDARMTEIYIKREEWDTKNSRWLVTKCERSDVKYDIDDNKIFDARYRWNGNDEWIGISRAEYKFNDYGDLLFESKMTWNIMDNEWKGVLNAEYDYDPMGNLILEIKRKWDPDTKDWRNLSKLTYEYDEYHNKVRESTFSWHVQQQKWEEFYKGKFEYSYDGGGNIKCAQEYMWDVKKWKPVMTVFYY